MSFILRQTAPEGVRFSLFLPPNQEIAIGRKPISTEASSLDIELDSDQIGSQHARIEVNHDETECWITDLGSQYGTQINGVRLEAWVQTPLSTGDKLSFGFDFIFILDERDRPSGSYNQLTSVVEDERLPVGISAAERHMPTHYMTGEQPYAGIVPPGLAYQSLKLIHLLPEIYRPASLQGNRALIQDGLPTGAPVTDFRTLLDQAILESSADFTSRLLALIESVLLPIEWTSLSFDLFLDVCTAPVEFLPWLEQWFMLLTDQTWYETQRRIFIQEANWLFARRGSKKALLRVLELYTGTKSEIVEAHDANADEGMAPCEFFVQVHVAPTFSPVDRAVVRKIIDTFKPAHTRYTFKMPDDA